MGGAMNALEQCFSNFNVLFNHLRSLVNAFPNVILWGGTQITPVLPVHGPHLEEHRPIM